MSDEKKFNVDNEKCVLVEFINEKSVSVAFQVWLLDNCENEDNFLSNIIKNEKIVKILWPNVDICTAAYMGRRLKKAEWSEHAVKILAEGGKWHIFYKLSINSSESVIVGGGMHASGDISYISDMELFPFRNLAHF